MTTRPEAADKPEKADATEPTADGTDVTATERPERTKRSGRAKRSDRATSTAATEADAADGPEKADAADTDADGVDESDASEAPASDRTRAAIQRVRAEHLRTRRRWLAATAALVVAVAFAGWSGWAWWTTGHNDDVALARARDQVLRAGSQEIATLHTVDYRHVDAGLGRWLAATTGELNGELRRDLAASRAQLTKQKAVTTGTVTAAAVTAVDRHAGTAQLIATVSTRVAQSGADPSTNRNRYQATLAQTPSGWKISTLIALPPE